MVQEFLWMSHVSTEGRLKDLNLTVFEGEILFLLSNHRGELEEIWQIIAGYRKITGGMLFLGEKRIAEYNEALAARYGIFHIDTNAQLVDSLSVAENIFAVRGRRGRGLFMLYRKKAAVAEAREVLKKVGLAIEPETSVWQLGPFERFQVCLAKALVNGARLLLIDDVENEYNASEKRRIRELIRELRGKGIASLILADRPGVLLDGARKIVLTKNGRDMKTYFSNEKTYFSQAVLYQTVARLWLGVEEKQWETGQKREGDEEPVNAPVICLFGRGPHIRLSPGCIYGFYDGFGDKAKSFGEQLLDFERENHTCLFYENGQQRYGFEELFKAGRAVYIPRESAFLLLENMAIGKNIAIPNKSRAAKSLYLSVNRIDDFLEEEFCRQISVPAGTPVWELNSMQKKILSIHRYLLQKPDILILEDPTYRLNIQEADGLREYLRTLSRRGFLILLSESSFYEEELICGAIIHTEKSCYKTTLHREDFSKLKAERLF